MNRSKLENDLSPTLKRNGTITAFTGGALAGGATGIVGPEAIQELFEVAVPENVKVALMCVGGIVGALYMLRLNARSRQN